MQQHPVPAGQLCALAHQLAGHRERRARGECDPQHRVRRGIVPVADGLLGGAQDRVPVLDDVVRREAAVAPAEVHRPPGGVEANPDLAGRSDLGAQHVTTVPGEDVVVVGAGCAAGARQPRQPGGGRHPHRVLVDASPDGVELREPPEQRGVDCQPPGDPLVEVVVDVDQTRCQQGAAGPDDPVGCTPDGVRRRPRAHRHDPVAVDDEVTAGVLDSTAVHRHDIRVLDDQSAHAPHPTADGAGRTETDPT